MFSETHAELEYKGEHIKTLELTLCWEKTKTVSLSVKTK